MLKKITATKNSIFLKKNSCNDIETTQIEILINQYSYILNYNCFNIFNIFKLLFNATILQFLKNKNLFLRNNVP